MARLFDNASSEYLQVNSAAVSAYPLAMACWANIDDATANSSLMWVGDKDVVDYNIRLLAIQAGGVADAVRAFSHDYGSGGGTQSANTSNNWSVNNWHHAAGIWLSASERHAYLDGDIGNKGSSAGAVDPMANHDRMAIGGNRDSTPDGYASGHIAEAAIWDLTNWGANDAAREAAFEKALESLAAGYSPLFYQLGLVAHWNLVRDINDKVGSFSLTASGTTVSNHPAIIYPAPTQVNYTTAAVPPAGNAGIMTTNTGFWGATF